MISITIIMIIIIIIIMITVTITIKTETINMTANITAIIATEQIEIKEAVCGQETAPVRTLAYVRTGVLEPPNKTRLCGHVAASRSPTRGSCAVWQHC